MSKNKSSNYNSLMRFILGTPIDFRENIKVIVAASLAAGCWISYGVLIHTQFAASRDAAAKITAFTTTPKAITPEDEKRIAIIKEANSVVNQTASSIYALITPVATAITGYFFISSGFKKSSNSADEEQSSGSGKENITEIKISPSNAEVGS